MAATFSQMRVRGRPFTNGMAKTGGRRKGVPNLSTRAVKEMIACAAQGLGGTKRLIEWAKESEKNEFAFWTTIWPRLLPLQVQGSGAHGEIELDVRFAGEELLKQLVERNLPPLVFGIDTPEPPALEAPCVVNGNGQDHPSDGNGSCELLSLAEERRLLGDV
jgi:hypothetical protein